MDTVKHDFTYLFQQLGLNGDAAAVEAFIRSHQLDHDVCLENAPFWSEAQVQFLRECRESDGDCSELVDELDASLRCE